MTGILEMLPGIAQALYIILFPLLAIQLAKRVKILDMIGPVVLCYIGGILVTFLPSGSLNQKVSTTISEAVIPLAIPLLVFSTDFMGWIRYAKKTALSFLLAIISVTFFALIASFLLGSYVDKSWQLSAMLAGVYTGGTPNLASIGLSLGVDNDTYLLSNAVDALLGGIYLLILLSVGKPLLGRFLPAFQFASESEHVHGMTDPDQGENKPKPRPFQLVIGILMSIAIVGISVGLSFLITGITGAEKRISVPIVMMGLTLPAIAVSFSKWVRELWGTYEAGEYLILVFCVAIGSMIEAGNLLQKGASFLAYFTFVMFGAITAHYLLCRVFRIDRDTAIITSTAAVFGPAFVPVMAENLKNKAVIISGLTTGLVGYAIGNYLGLGIAYILKP